MSRSTYRTVAVLMALLVGGCTDNGIPTEVSRAAPAPAADWLEGQYVTEDEFLGAGGNESGSLTAANVLGGLPVTSRVGQPQHRSIFNGRTASRPIYQRQS